MDDRSKRVAIISGNAGGIGRDIVAKLGDAGFVTIGVDCIAPIEDIPVFVTDLNLFVNSPQIQHEFMKFSQPYCAEADEITLINNAAIQITGNMMRLSTDEVTQSFNINVIAPFFALPALVNTYEQKLRTIINISSIHSKLIKVNFGAYAMSKASLSALTHGPYHSKLVITQEFVKYSQPQLIPRCRAGLEDTSSLSKLESYHPSRKIGCADDIASVVLAILRTPSIFLNGMVVNLDGGISNRLHDPD